MLFGKRVAEKRIKRILIVEDEPLVAFDNEHFLTDAGYDVVATVDTVAEAVRVIREDGIDLVLADVSLSDGGNGIEVAVAARDKGTPLLFVTGECPAEAQALSIGCLAKPYSQRDLLGAIQAVDAKLSGAKVRRAPGALKLFG